jgi:hypothetical protein
VLLLIGGESCFILIYPSSSSSAGWVASLFATRTFTPMAILSLAAQPRSIHPSSIFHILLLAWTLADARVATR